MYIHEDLLFSLLTSLHSGGEVQGSKAREWKKGKLYFPGSPMGKLAPAGRQDIWIEYGLTVKKMNISPELCDVRIIH